MSDSLSSLTTMARDIRTKIIKTGYQAGAVHFGSSLSCVELLLAIHLHKQPQDCFILSKGHAALSLYATLETLGVITPEQLISFNHEGSIFCSHHGLHPEFGLNMTNGSLGLGLSFGVGKALAYAQQENPHEIYVMCGNGELNEGSVLETLMFVGAHKLKHITLIVDDNQLQLDGYSDQILPLPAKTDWLKDLGWHITEVDGHDINTIMQTLQTPNDMGARLIYAHTVKGKGISFMEGQPRFHHAALTQSEYQQALEELSSVQDTCSKSCSHNLSNTNQTSSITTLNSHME